MNYITIQIFDKFDYVNMVEELEMDTDSVYLSLGAERSINVSSQRNDWNTKTCDKIIWSHSIKTAECCKDT